MTKKANTQKVMARRSNRRDRNWFSNPDQLKHPKIFTMKAVRTPDGAFHLLGGETLVLSRENQYKSKWINVDTRDFARELRNSRITTK